MKNNKHDRSPETVPHRRMRNEGLIMKSREVDERTDIEEHLTALEIATPWAHP